MEKSKEKLECTQLVMCSPHQHEALPEIKPAFETPDVVACTHPAAEEIQINKSLPSVANQPSLIWKPQTNETSSEKTDVSS